MQLFTDNQDAMNNAVTIANNTIAILDKIKAGTLSPNAAIVALHVMQSSLDAGYIYSFVSIPMTAFSRLLGIKTATHARNYVNEAVKAGVIERVAVAGMPSTYMITSGNI